ncbi:MAG: hypothetical protein PHR06_06645 [Candidatus Cloacimonetes bacterium]|nr:hypothetical protein [Candidatus Cloacimonadota bacterium]
MRQEFYNSPIEVVCYFEKNEVRPLRFRWKNEIVKVHRTNGYWAKHEGTVLYHFFAVSDKFRNYYELQFNANSLEWHLRKIVDEI